MKNENQMKIRELIFRIIAPFVFLIIGTCIIFPFAKGLPVTGVPKAHEIVKAEISDARTDGKTVTVTSREEIELAVNMKNFLLCEIGSSYNSNEKGDIVIRYFNSDGDVWEISATETTLYWNGKARQLKNKGVFVDVAEEIFF